MGRWITTALLVAAVTAGSAAGGPAALGQPELRATPDVVGGQLSAVTCTSAGDCWAVGSDSASDPTSALILHWNGSVWRQVASPSPPGAIDPALHGVACARATNCWAVGDYSNAGDGTIAYAEHWNGTAWSAVTMPGPAGSDGAGLIAIQCPSTAWCIAGGNYLGGDGLIERWNGRSWRQVVLPVVPKSQADHLTALSCASAGDCWAVGYWVYYPVSGNPPYVGDGATYHWNGTNWTAASLGVHNMRNLGLFTVSCPSPAMCLTTGQTHTVPPWIRAWNGSSWAVVPYAPSKPYPVIAGLDCTSAELCLAVGSTAKQFQNSQTFAARWDGSSWSTLTTPDVAKERNALTAVTCTSATNCWAVGGWTAVKSSPGTIAEHWNGTAWVIVAT